MTCQVRTTPFFLFSNFFRSVLHMGLALSIKERKPSPSLATVNKLIYAGSRKTIYSPGASSVYKRGSYRRIAGVEDSPIEQLSDHRSSFPVMDLHKSENLKHTIVRLAKRRRALLKNIPPGNNQPETHPKARRGADFKIGASPFG